MRFGVVGYRLGVGIIVCGRFWGKGRWAEVVVSRKNPEISKDAARKNSKGKNERFMTRAVPSARYA